MLELYHWEPTSNSGEVLILLKEKALDFSSRYVDLLKFEQHAPAFLKVNPQAQAPALVHDGKTITETGFILQYIEQVFPEPSFTPSDAQGRYWVNVWIKYVNEYLAPAAWRLGLAGAGADLSNAQASLARAPAERRQLWEKLAAGVFDDPEELEIAEALIPTRLARMQEALEAHDYLAGPAYSVADIAVYPTLKALAALTSKLVNADATPKVMQWLERVGERPAVKAAMSAARMPQPEKAFAPGPEGSRWG